MILFSITKVNKLQFGILWSEKEFFKSNMDALTVLSIWDTGTELEL